MRKELIIIARDRKQTLSEVIRERLETNLHQAQMVELLEQLVNTTKDLRSLNIVGLASVFTIPGVTDKFSEVEEMSRAIAGDLEHWIDSGKVQP